MTGWTQINKERPMETKTTEKEIVDKAREWIEEYGEDFLVELLDA